MPSNEFRTLKRKEQEGEGIKTETAEQGEGGKKQQRNEGRKPLCRQTISEISSYLFLLALTWLLFTFQKNVLKLEVVLVWFWRVNV